MTSPSKPINKPGPLPFTSQCTYNAKRKFQALGYPPLAIEPSPPFVPLFPFTPGGTYDNALGLSRVMGPKESTISALRAVRPPETHGLGAKATELSAPPTPPTPATPRTTSRPALYPHPMANGNDIFAGFNEDIVVRHAEPLEERNAVNLNLAKLPATATQGALSAVATSAVCCTPGLYGHHVWWYTGPSAECKKTACDGRCG